MVLNKVDVPAARELAEMVRPMLEERGLTVFEISAATHEGLRPLSFALAELVAAARAAAARGRAHPPRAAPRGRSAARSSPSRRSRRAASSYEAPSPSAGSRQTRFDNDEAVGYLADRLAKLGVEKALAEAGAEPGAEVTIGDVTFDWQPSLDGVAMPGPRGTRPAAGRTGVTGSRRVVVKVGSSSLTSAAGGLDRGPARRPGRRPRGRAGPRR